MLYKHLLNLTHRPHILPRDNSSLFDLPLCFSRVFAVRDPPMSLRGQFFIFLFFHLGGVFTTSGYIVATIVSSPPIDCGNGRVLHPKLRVCLPVTSIYPPRPCYVPRGVGMVDLKYLGHFWLSCSYLCEADGLSPWVLLRLFIPIPFPPEKSFPSIGRTHAPFMSDLPRTLPNQVIIHTSRLFSTGPFL